MQTNSTPPGQMTQGQYPLAQQQPGQAPSGAMHQGLVHPEQMHPGQRSQGQIPQGQPGQMQQQYPAAQQWNQAPPPQYDRGYGQSAAGQPPVTQAMNQTAVNQAAVNQTAVNQTGVGQVAVGHQGYRPTQSQISQAQGSPPMTQAQAEQLQASRMQANQAAAQAAIQHSPRGPLATAPRQRGYGPTDPTQYLQREAAAQVATQAVTNRYAQPYGNQLPNGSAGAMTGGHSQTSFQGNGTEGWTGAHQPRPHQTGIASRSPLRPTPNRRRYRHEVEEDFVPNFGQAQQPSSESWLLSLPVINWHNLPLGNMRFWTALGGIVFAAIMLNVLGTSPVISSIVKSRNRQCQEVIQPNSVLSRQQLTQLIAVPERSPKANIHEIIREPYCLLPSLNIRAGVNAVREAYPLEFDPDTWIVVLYEGDEYAGYRFNAR